MLIVIIAAFVECQSSDQAVSKISFTRPELDCIYPVTQGYSCTFDAQDVNPTGVITVLTEDFSVTSTGKRSFSMDGADVLVSFGISQSFSTKVAQPPLTRHSTMTMEIAATKDYEFLMRICLVDKEFIQYMCYRRNVFLSSAELSTPTENGQRCKCVIMHVVAEPGDNKEHVLPEGRYTKLPDILGHEHLILNDIAARSLYIRHLPDTFQSGNQITAAFEWEFSRAYRWH